jgi:hypothetical protein
MVKEERKWGAFADARLFCLGGVAVDQGVWALYFEYSFQQLKKT